MLLRSLSRTMRQRMTRPRLPPVAVVAVPKRSIAAARNGGANVANGDILCFIDADSQIDPESFNAITTALDRVDAIGGVTGCRLERWSLGIALTYAVVSPLARLINVDGGVYFCRAPDFNAVGGYDESRLIGEEAPFMAALRQRGKERRQRLLHLTHVKAIVSARKFDQHGDWHFLKMLPTLVVAVVRPSAGQKLAERFWYADDR
ncbi:MAG TPA: glycosyltransferase [Verrucomicrobia bacterium]|nr:glycosyltransferase [Verrucomicrobiota bacterium]